MTATTPDMRPRPMSAMGWAALLVVYVVWGSTYLGIGIVIETVPPLLSGGMRFIAAALLLGGYLAVRHGPGVLRVPRRRLLATLLVGMLLLTTGGGMVAIAEQHISTGLTALLIASVPLWLVVFRTATGDRPAPLTLIGVAVGFAGVAMLSMLQGGSGGNERITGSVFGVIVILGAALSWATGSFLSGKLPMPANTYVASVYEMLAGGVTLSAIGLLRGESLDLAAVSGRSWLALAYLVTFGSLLAFTSYIWLLGQAPISLVGTYAFVNPTVAVLLGALFLGETITWQTVAGWAIIVAGVGLVVSTEGRGPSRNVAPRAPEERGGAPVMDVAGRARAGGTSHHR